MYCFPFFYVCGGCLIFTGRGDTCFINLLKMFLSFLSLQSLCEDEGRPAGGAKAAGGQDPAGGGAAERAEGESGTGTGAGNGHGNVDGIRTILKPHQT